MNAERWRRIKTVFAAVVEADPRLRSNLVEDLCAGDQALRREVYSLIAAHESASSKDWRMVGQGPSYRPDPDFAGNARFEILSRLGAGGFGVVYQARDRHLGRPVALKVLRESDASGMIRFKREFRMLADLSHPNLVRLNELFVESGYVFFTMELVLGKPIVSALTPPAGAAADEARIGRAFAALVDGVGALHAEGVVHRDLKPSNVLLADEGRVVVLDFGLAADIREPAMAPVTAAVSPKAHGMAWACGTPAYMAPEQFQGRAASEASDWYGVGTMLFETLAGRLPFSGDVVSLAESKRAAAPVLPKEIATAFPVLAPLAEAMLAPDPGARPDGIRIAEWLARIAGVPQVARKPARAAGAGIFVGRESQLSALRAAWSRAQSGELAVVCVRGASGMGKTALVRRFLDELEDVRILAGRCHEREALGYKALDGVVDGLGQFLKSLPQDEATAMLPAGFDDLVRVFPVLGSSPHPSTVAAVAESSAANDLASFSRTDASRSGHDTDPRRHAFDALRELVGAVARRCPCVVFIDDLQWGDDDSATLLRYLLRPPGAPPLLVLAACRGEEQASPSFAAMLESLRASGRMEEIFMQALGVDETRELAKRLLGVSHGAAVEAIVADAGGVPFFVDTLVERLQEREGDAAEAGPRGGRDGAARELSLQAVLSERVGALASGARRLLEVVALAGMPLSRRVAHDAAGLGGVDEGAAEHLLRARHLLRLGADGASLETYHDRIREVVTDGIAPPILPELHRNIAQALRASGSADPEAMAHHLAAAGEGMAAADYAVTAARQRAQSLAFDRAAALFRTAIKLKGPDHPDIGHLTLELADVLAAAGRGALAGEAYLEVSERLPAVRREAQFKGAVQYLRAGYIALGRALMRKVLRDIGWRVPRTTVGALLAVVLRRAQLAVRGLYFRKGWVPGPNSERNLLRIDACWTLASSALMVDAVHATYYQTHNLLTALEEGEPVTLARALGLEAIHASLPGARSSARVDRILQLLREITKSVRNPIMDGLAPLAEGVVSANRGQWRRAHDHSLAATKLLAAHGQGVTWELATARFFLLGALVSLGEFREFSRIFPDFLEDSRSREDLYAESILVLSSGAYIVPIREDRSRDATAMVDAALGRLPAHGYQVPKAWAHFAKVDVALYEGNVDGAWSLEVETWPRIARSILVFMQTIRIYLRHQRGRVLLALAEKCDDAKPRRRWLRMVEAEARHLERESLPWSDGFALGLRAGVAMGRGDRSTAATLLRTSVEKLETAEMGMHAESGRLMWGRVTGGAGGREATARAEAWMRGQEIVCPDRVARTVYPGFEGA